MNARLSPLVLPILLVGCGGPDGPIPVEEHSRALGQARKAPDFTPFQALVKFRRDVSKVDASQLPRARQVSELRGQVGLVELDDDGGDAGADPVEATWAMIERLREHPDVEYAHPNWRLQLSATPTDPLYPRQWHYPRIQLPSAWDLTTGSPSIRIAVLDSGRTAHSDLTPKWTPGLEYDAVHQDGDPSANLAQEPWAHGTHVAGIAAGSTRDGGSAGVCWDCQLLHVKVGTTVLGRFTVDLVAVVRGLYWATDNGANVVNMSFEQNGLPCSRADHAALIDALDYATARNVSLVAAAGNQGLDAAQTIPASCPGVIAVAATDRNDALATYSNRGVVTLSAPGGGGTHAAGGGGYGAAIDCPVPLDPAGSFESSDLGVVSSWTTSRNEHCHRYLSGTSMAAPHVAGVIGLMLSRNPSLSPSAVRQILRKTSRPLPACLGRCGSGLVDARAAVEAAAPLPPPGDAPPLPAIAYACTGLECTFDGRGSTDDRGILAYQWSFPGQQKRATALTSFFMPGYDPRPVVLRVTDSSGQSREVTRFVAPPRPSRVLAQLGSYYNPARSGHGIDLYQNDFGHWVVTWYTYDAAGTPVWYMSGAGPRINQAQWRQPLYRATWNGTSASLAVVGDIALDFSSSSTAWLSWTLDGVPGGERFTYLFGGAGRSGAWYAPSESGWGINVQEAGTTLAATLAFYEFGTSRWMQGTTTASANATISMVHYTGRGLCPSCQGTQRPVPTLEWGGTLNLQVPTGVSTTGQVATDIRYSVILPKWIRPLTPIALLTSP